MHAIQDRTAGLLCLLVTALGWGMNWPAMKLLLRELPPLFARGSAGMVAAAALALAALALGQSLVLPRALVGRLLLAAFTNVFAWMGFTTLSLRWLDAGQAALLVYTMPIWATLLAWPLHDKRPSMRAAAGLALALAGIYTLLGGQGFGLGPDKLPGVLLALAAALLFAFGTIAIKPLPLPPLTALAWQVGLGCLPMMLLGLMFEQPNLRTLSAGGWGILAYMTVLPMCLCYLTWFAALRRLPPATASIATLLTPVIGVSAAAAILGEPFGAREVTALTLTIGGVALVLLRRT